MQSTKIQNLAISGGEVGFLNPRGNKRADKILSTL